MSHILGIGEVGRPIGAGRPTAPPVTEPDLYEMDADTYHADPVPGGSLSSSGARLLLPPNCPARYAYERSHQAAPKREYDLGHAAHKLVLGAGPDLVVIDADSYRTKSAREAQTAAHAAGKVPLLSAEHDQVQAMAAAIRAHPIASRLFNPAGGTPEQSLFWVDDESGVWRRARLDWLPDPARPGRMIVADYKTTGSAAPDAVSRTVHSYGYHLQAAWYLDAVTALGLAPDPAFVLVFQEKTPPYLVLVAEPDAAALHIGRHLNRQALEIYAECQATGHWPGYSNEVELLSLPPWAARRHPEEPW